MMFSWDSETCGECVKKDAEIKRLKEDLQKTQDLYRKAAGQREKLEIENYELRQHKVG